LRLNFARRYFFNKNFQNDSRFDTKGIK
jgi:hypothetical protein